MEFLIVLAVAAVAVWWFVLRNKETSVTEAAPYKVEAPEKTETVTHSVAGLTVVDTVPASPAVEAAPEAKPAKTAKKKAAPRKKKAEK